MTLAKEFWRNSLAPDPNRVHNDAVWRQIAEQLQVIIGNCPSALMVDYNFVGNPAYQDL